MTEHWENITWNPKSLGIIDELFKKHKDNPDFDRILAALMCRLNRYTHEKETESSDFVLNHREVIENSNVGTFYEDDAYGLYAGWLDHCEQYTNRLVGRPYEVILDLKTLEQFKTMVEGGLKIIIRGDRVHFPGRTVEVLVR